MNTTDSLIAPQQSVSLCLITFAISVCVLVLYSNWLLEKTPGRYHFFLEAVRLVTGVGLLIWAVYYGFCLRPS